MAISILDRETEKLAREVAAKTGESVEDAVLHALSERLERLKVGPAENSNVAESLMAISRRCSQLPDFDLRDPDEILAYDAAGAFG